MGQINQNEKKRYQNIKKLLSERKYEEIYRLYGSQIYTKYVPKKYQKEDIKKLIEEKRFNDVYFKYGEKIFNKYKRKIQQIDVLMETGSKPKSVLNRLKNEILLHILPNFLITSLSITASMPVALGVGNQGQKEYQIEHIEVMDEYNEYLKNYASYINSLKIDGDNLNYSQIIVKVIYDMWNSIEGYGEPKSENIEFPRIALFLYKKGVCRHMADDTAAKLNIINKDFNARVMTCNFDVNKDYNFVDGIDIKFATTNESTIENNNNERVTNFLQSSFGNHAVTVADIPGENTTVIIDPTNPSMGVFYKGKIYMFSTEDGKGLNYKFYAQALLNGYESALKFSYDQLESFFEPDCTLEELEEKWGIEALNKALEQVKKAEGKKEKTNDFKTSIKAIVKPKENTNNEKYNETNKTYINMEK